MKSLSVIKTADEWMVVKNTDTVIPSTAVPNNSILMVTPQYLVTSLVTDLSGSTQ